MKKRAPRLSEKNLKDIWNIRILDGKNSELGDLEQFISSAVSRCLREGGKTRAEQAVRLSDVLGDDISSFMLDAYSSEVRREHKISASRFFALIAITGRFDIFDAIVREIGGKALSQSDAKVFRIGHDYVASLEAEKRLRDRVSDLSLATKP